MEEKQNNKDRLKEITAGIEQGIRELWSSDKYKSYLQTMSRFHRYSVNNVMLIHAQMPSATRVAGFNRWRDQFDRHVKKGAKAIQIIAPMPVNRKVETVKLDPETKTPMLDQNGNAIKEQKIVKVPMFKVVSVFDVSQTEGKPLPELASDLTGNVEQYEVFLEALRRASPVPIDFKPLSHNTDGYFSLTDQSITIREGMSEVQTVSALIHEIAHSKLHNREQGNEKDRRTEEVEAESISYSVCQYYGVETGENSFGYIASWSAGKELKELRESLETINATASGLIEDIDRNFAEICKERGIAASKRTEQEAISQAVDTQSDTLAHDLERKFERDTEDGVLIYQLKDTAPMSLNFTSFDRLKEAPNTENYRAIYAQHLNDVGSKSEVLEQVFEQFNAERPADFTGHSLSVSDIVAIKRGGEVSYYYCDCIGFKELENFKTENYLKAAEMSMEDDYGMIDGIINNGPKEEPEKKTSVLEKLKNQPIQKHKKNAPKKSAERESR